MTKKVVTFVVALVAIGLGWPDFSRPAVTAPNGDPCVAGQLVVELSPDLRDLNALVDAENKDRNRLYEVVAKALNIDPGQIDKIEKIFAREWQKSVP